MSKSSAYDFLIEGHPVPWAAHKGFGRRSFNPRFKEKSYFQWKIREQYKSTLLKGPVHIFFEFLFSIPKSVSKKNRIKMINHLEHHTKRPDVSNCVKFTEDCLKGIVIEDDSQVVYLSASKGYSEHPCTKVHIVDLQEIDHRAKNDLS